MHPSNLFFYFNIFLLSKQRRNRPLFLTSAVISAFSAFDQYVKKCKSRYENFDLRYGWILGPCSRARN